MRAILQRVTRAQVSVDGSITGRIKNGWLVLFGVGNEDTDQDLRYIVDKTLHLRGFSDEQAKMNRSLLDVGGSILCISQFTLFGDCRKGRRPSFTQSAAPDLAQKFYQKYMDLLQDAGVTVEAGVFGADMQVELCNSGPVTFSLDSKKLT